MLAGEPPFKGETTQAILAGESHAAPPASTTSVKTLRLPVQGDREGR